MSSVTQMHPADIVTEVTFEWVCQGRRHRSSFVRPHKIRELLGDDETSLGAFLRGMVRGGLDATDEGDSDE